MQGEAHQIIHTGEPLIAVPTHVEPNLPLQVPVGSVPETIFAIAVLIRSIALLIKVIGQQKERK
ncbi:MAG: hypothetical protein RID53_23610 [Coleofasciculus sp. B1-GNL1-01]|uniref:hypothetical protein n=1 Tax=Coleofasciculus sp. B1-GNL1-01 TaxID=3068484 RepID=UPI0033027749